VLGLVTDATKENQRPPAAGHWKGKFRARLPINTACDADDEHREQVAGDDSPTTSAVTKLDDKPEPKQSPPQLPPIAATATSSCEGLPTPPLPPSDRAYPGQFPGATQEETQTPHRSRQVHGRRLRPTKSGTEKQAQKVLQWYADHLPAEPPLRPRARENLSSRETAEGDDPDERFGAR